MMLKVAALMTLAAAPALAETLVASTTIRARTSLGPEHLTVVSKDMPGALRDPLEAIGLETRVTLYAGRPIRAADLAEPALVERNQVVPLRFSQNGLVITAEGRVLDRAAAGERIRVMNLDSRMTVYGTVTDDAAILVSE